MCRRLQNKFHVSPRSTPIKFHIITLFKHFLDIFSTFRRNKPSSLFFRCVAGDEALEKQKKEMAELKRKVDNAQAAMMELTQENQSLQVWLKKKRQISLGSISIKWHEVLFWLEATRVKRGKTCNRCQARENMQPVFCAGKHGTGAMRYKT